MRRDDLHYHLAILVRCDFAMSSMGPQVTDVISPVIPGAEPQCGNCLWFSRIDNVPRDRAPRGACGRYPDVSTDKLPHVRSDDWCFEHRS